MKKSTPKVIVIVGPNASGKSELGVKLAKKLNGEIISADSRQVYKKLDVGSGKVRGEWKKIDGQKKFVYKNIPHYCIDMADPKKVFTAADYRQCAQKAILDILSRGKTPIIVGGTGFYIDAALGRVKLGGVPPNQKLRRKLSKKSAAELLAMFRKLDPKRAKTVEQKNPRRLIRAIEISKSRNISEVEPPIYRGSTSIIWLGIKHTPEELKRRIRNRLLRRLQGIIKETKQLHANPPAGGGVSWKRFYDLGLEYRYASLYLRGKLSHLQLTQQLASQIWYYAKRQMTWFKKNEEIRWISSKKKRLCASYELT